MISNYKAGLRYSAGIIAKFFWARVNSSSGNVRENVQISTNFNKIC